MRRHNPHPRIEEQDMRRLLPSLRDRARTAPRTPAPPTPSPTPAPAALPPTRHTR